jgi:hypothetical protein
MEAGLWAIPMSSGSPDVDRMAELLEPEQSSSDRGPMIYIDLVSLFLRRNDNLLVLFQEILLEFSCEPAFKLCL